VIADLAVDPYLLENNPPTVRGVEGIPAGQLNKFTFQPDDPDWDNTVPASVPSASAARLSPATPGLGSTRWPAWSITPASSSR
jgi:hypothetical protein